jgi:RimJ/RimL family protein N-acetyltransferase
VIRQATHADVPALVAGGLEFAASSEYAAHFTADPFRIARTMRGLLENPDAWIAVIDAGEGRLEGAIGLALVENLWAAEAHACEVFWWVRPAARGRAGLELLVRAEQWAHARQAAGVAMIAPNLRVGALLTRRGYGLMESTYFKRAR